jgi:hypothetical protein
MDLQTLNDELARRYFEALGYLENEMHFDEVPQGLTLPEMSTKCLFFENVYALNIWDSETFAWNQGYTWCLRELAQELGLNPDAWQAPEINPATSEPWKQGELDADVEVEA